MCANTHIEGKLKKYVICFIQHAHHFYGCFSRQSWVSQSPIVSLSPFIRMLYSIHSFWLTYSTRRLMQSFMGHNALWYQPPGNTKWASLLHQLWLLKGKWQSVGFTSLYDATAPIVTAIYFYAKFFYSYVSKTLWYTQFHMHSFVSIKSFWRITFPHTPTTSRAFSNAKFS